MHSRSEQATSPHNADDEATFNSNAHGVDDDPSRPFVTGSWWCPVCDEPTPRRYRSGRQKVYCSNACRQRSYRWRRAHGVRLFVTADAPAERAESRTLRHALRDPRDPVAALRTQPGREVTVCGTFARPARSQRVRHIRFLPHSTSACQSCLRNVGVDLETFVDAPEFMFDTQEFWAHVKRTSKARAVEHSPRPQPRPLPIQRPLWQISPPVAAVRPRPPTTGRRRSGSAGIAIPGGPVISFDTQT